MSHSDCRRHDCHRAAKGAFQGQQVKASLRRAIEQLRHVQPWATTTKPAPVRQEVQRG